MGTGAILGNQKKIFHKNLFKNSTRANRIKTHENTVSHFYFISLMQFIKGMQMKYRFILAIPTFLNL